MEFTTFPVRNLIIGQGFLDFNMPFELGLFLGANNSRKKQSEKITLILDRDAFVSEVLLRHCGQ